MRTEKKNIEIRSCVCVSVQQHWVLTFRKICDYDFLKIQFRMAHTHTHRHTEMKPNYKQRRMAYIQNICQRQLFSGFQFSL